MTIRRALISFMLTIFGLVSTSIAQQRESKPVIEVPVGESRTFMLSNDIGLYFCGETNQHNTARYHGLSFLTEEFLEDLLLEIGGKPLDRGQAKTTLYPDSLKRFYSQLQLTETITLPDSIPALIMRLESPKRYLLKIVPVVSGSRRLRDFNISWDTNEKILFVSRRNQFVQNPQNHKVSLMGIFSYPLSDFFDGEFGNFTSLNLHQKFNSVVAGELNTMLDRKALVLVILGDTKKEITTLRNKILNKWHIEFEAPKTQIEGIRKI
ncbi:MAG: hypothetical protein GXO74_00135 [Calditrichaeota bacterium]|nr:hypothetical protein [Calditrichota bacterium]